MLRSPELELLLAHERIERIERELQQRQLIRQAKAARPRRTPFRLALGRGLIVLGRWLAALPQVHAGRTAPEPSVESESWVDRR